MTRILFAWVIAVGGVGFIHAEDETPASPRFSAVESDDAWKLLPRENPPLPAWARVLVEPLPKTTGLMLELDHLHRAKNPIGQVLAGKLRWAAADEIGCDYARKYAEADLRRAGLSDDDLKQLAGDGENLREDDRLALDFARKLTSAAYQVTDDDVAELLKRFGPEVVVGMVHTLAHANFQNRIFLALGVKVEPGGPLPPLDVPLDAAKRTEIAAPERPAWEELQKVETPSKAVARPDWGERSFAAIEQALEKQKERAPRIPLPGAERLAKVPPEAREQAAKIVWTHVSMGYQPLLTKAWFDCMGTFRQESKMDRVFNNSVFWVITRSNECFY
jgi:alkylhydroperoxidase family enzyme